MKTALARWGDTLAIRLPEAELAKAGLLEGAMLDVVVQANTVVISNTQETREQFTADLWTNKNERLTQEPLWDGGHIGSELL